MKDDKQKWNVEFDEMMQTSLWNALKENADYEHKGKKTDICNDH